jgi:hypothetical protein
LFVPIFFRRWSKLAKPTEFGSWPSSPTNDAYKRRSSRLAANVADRKVIAVEARVLVNSVNAAFAA